VDLRYQNFSLGIAHNFLDEKWTYDAWILFWFYLLVLCFLSIGSLGTFNEDGSQATLNPAESDLFSPETLDRLIGQQTNLGRLFNFSAIKKDLWKSVWKI